MPQVTIEDGGAMHTLMAPPVLPEMVGCISSVRHALLGAGDNPSMLSRGALITSTETAMLRLQESNAADRWGVLWAQISCPDIANEWPLGSVETDWGEAHGTVTWLLAGGAGEGEDHISLRVPPSQRAVWRPLALVRAARVEWYLRDPGCALEFVYKGTRHPADAPVCEGASNIPADGEPSLVRPARASWYTPPDNDGLHFTTAATVRWLTSYAFHSRGAHSMLISSDSPWLSGGYNNGMHEEGQVSSSGAWHVPDGCLTTASECVHGRCAPQFVACYRESSCRDSWDAFASHQGKVPWNQTAMYDFLNDGDRVGSWTISPDSKDSLRALVGCFWSMCTCQARGDDTTHVVRFTGGDGLTNEEVASVFDLAERIGGATRRAFGLAEGGLASPSAAHKTSRYPEMSTKTVAQGHRVTYLHGSMSTALPKLHAKLVALVQRAHNESGWSVIEPSRLTVRTIELLDYEHSSDSLGWHIDEQSALTALVMLTDPAEFEGALLQHEVRGRDSPVTAKMSLGDVTVYRSHQAHRVTPLTSGRRKVMAIEFWHDMAGSDPLFEQDSGTGEPTARRGRPHRRYGQCPA